MSNALHPPRETGSNRRCFLSSGQTFLSAGIVAMLAGCAGNAAMPMSFSSAEGDVAILNVALGLEHEAIAVYQIGAESRLLDKPVLDVAVLFHSHHKEHRDALATTVRMLGGAPVEPKMMKDYATTLNAGALKQNLPQMALSFAA